MKIKKYPRTHHLEGSRLQPGDHDLNHVPFATLEDMHWIIEEKIDGANAGISFSDDGKLLLQSRGHYLTGGDREKHFDLFKLWANTQQDILFDLLGDRFIMFGEWMFAKHTVYYDLLPHYFMEFDIYDKETGKFLSTPTRRKMLEGYPIASVPVLSRGTPKSLKVVTDLVRISLYKSPTWKESLIESCPRNADIDTVLKETDMSDTSEGVYIKIEEGDEVINRLKWIRPSFLTSVEESQTHWLNRPIVPNDLAPEADLFQY